MLTPETGINHIYVRTCDVDKLVEHLIEGFELIHQDYEVTQVATVHPLEMKSVDILMLQHIEHYKLTLLVREFTETDITTVGIKQSTKSTLATFKKYVVDSIDNYHLFKLNLATGDSDDIRSID